MQNVLEKLFNGELDFDEKVYPHDRETYKQVMDRESELESELLKRLDKEEKEIFNAALDENMKRAIMETDQAFVCGFKLGAMIVIECFTD